mmetsp:Transcript_741/g.1451  ORF Transcript_741/g.1451 Transcript_741/m.1451 type:complete len:99 (+) Transcript_741:2464-2760(+)
MYSLSRELLDLFNYSDYLHNLQVWDLSVRHLLRRHVPYRLQEILERQLHEEREQFERNKAEWVRKEEEMMRRVRELEDETRKTDKSKKKGGSCHCSIL